MEKYYSYIKERRQLMLAVSKLDFGHQYLGTDELKVFNNLREQEVPLEVTAKVIADRRHLQDKIGRWNGG